MGWGLWGGGGVERSETDGLGVVEEHGGIGLVLILMQRRKEIITPSIM